MASIETHMNDQDQKLLLMGSDIKDIKLILEKNGHLEDKVSGLEKEIIAIKLHIDRDKWVGRLIYSGFSAGVTFLLIQYLQNLK